MPTVRFSPPPPTEGEPWIAVPDDDEVDAVERELERLATVREDPDDDETRPFDQGDALSDVVPLVEALLDEPSTSTLVAHLLLVCRHPVAAEVIGLQCAFGARVAREDITQLLRLADRAKRRALSTEEYVLQLQRDGWEPDTPSARMREGESRRRPDAERVRRGIRMLREAASYADAEEQAALFCALGWLHWARGQRAIAQSYLTAAILRVPDDATAWYLTTMVGAMTPRWLAVPRKGSATTPG